MNKGKRSVGFLILVLLLSGIPFLLLFISFKPEPLEPFEVSGEFSGNYYGGTVVCLFCGERNNEWAFEIMREGDFENPESGYENFGRGFISDFPDRVFYHVRARGNWCGDLPDEGVMVNISSPTGYTRNLTITEISTGRIYTTDAKCTRPTLTFHYRVTERETGVIIAEGTVEGRDSYRAWEKIPDLDEFMLSDEFVFQGWESSKPAPPLIELER